ncbi:ATP-binding protein [Candidatus Viridilinea mediisalina]|uniref:Histidine kinase domain-containing protein n=1 Tax=Candidatus Viridilinea mediisalina TaxID=2024553 RepID=A0A2A6RM99_9CHLR|nr:ATP-binding protein [Candidatus Viridilinea mediisalina]PDW04008.1 hypothetical protein CJ255_05985 [Candidatus Viridilinea mediisalina]
MTILLQASDLAALAPTALPTYRQERYQGDAMDIALDAFDPEHRVILQQMYALLTQLRQLSDPHQAQPVGLDTIQQILREHEWKRLVDGMRTISLPATAPIDPLRASQVLHDLRGGALQAIVLLLGLVDLGITGEQDLLRLWLLSRDHLKIFRNALTDIDPEGSALDQAHNLHHINLILEKWQQAIYTLSDAQATIHVDCAFDGYVAERCLEFAALDRILYNLINNAVRHSPDSEVALAILPLPADKPSQLRLGVANRLTPAQHMRLNQLVEGDHKRLFAGGLTIGGSGHGLRICADFVQRAFGLRQLDLALAMGYLGVSVPDERIIFWVHWPVAGE